MRDRLTGWVFGETGQPFTKDVAEIRHIDEELPPMEPITPDAGDEEMVPPVHPVEKLLREIAENTSKQENYDENTDTTSQMFFCQVAAGVLNIDVAKERPYILITGDNGVPRNLVISRGLGGGIPVSPCPKNAVFLMQYPYTDQLSITYDAGASIDNIYVHFSSRQINVALVK